jgi:hypothetical protein
VSTHHLFSPPPELLTIISYYEAMERLASSCIRATYSTDHVCSTLLACPCNPVPKCASVEFHSQSATHPTAAFSKLYVADTPENVGGVAATIIPKLVNADLTQFPLPELIQRNHGLRS